MSSLVASCLMLFDQDLNGLKVPGFVERIQEADLTIEKAELAEILTNEIEPRVPPLGQILVFEHLPRCQA